MQSHGDPGFRLEGIEPQGDPAFAKRSARRAFWSYAAKVGHKIWDQRTRRGIGADGRPLTPIRQATRKARRRWDYSPMGRANPDNPPLQATGSLSRTRSYLRTRVEDNSAWFYWIYDPHTHVNWGVILARHRTGFATVLGGRSVYVPPRDVIGFSPADLAQIKAKADAWWKRNRDRWASPFEGLVPGKVAAPFATGFRQFRAEGVRAMPAPIHLESLGRLSFGPPPPPQPPRPAGGLGAPPKPRPRPMAPRPERRVPALVGVEADGPLPDEVRRQLPPELEGVETFGELARTKAGRAWWRLAGYLIWTRMRRAG